MEDIVKALNNYVKHNYGVTGSFMSTKNFTVDKNFRAIKHYKMWLYYVNNGKSTPIIEEGMSVKEGTEGLERLLNIKFLEAVYDYVASEEFKQLMDGTINI